MKKQILETFHRFGLIVKTIDNRTDEHVYKELYPSESIEKRLFFNIGAGTFKHPCWTNVDGESDWYDESNKNNQNKIAFDLFSHQPLPVKDQIAELLYTSHTIEHADDESVSFLFQDAHRMLKKGGTFRIVTPNIDMSYAAWQRNDRKYFYWIEWEHLNKNFEKQCINMPLSQASLAQIFLEDFAADASELSTVGGIKRISDTELYQLFKDLPYEDALNYCTSFCTIENQKKYPFHHMNWFNEIKLTRMLKQAGFSSIKRSGYLQSEVPVLRNVKYFDNMLPQISIYMEAVK